MRIAEYRAKELLKMINRGVELTELLVALEDWKKSTSNKKSSVINPQLLSQ